MARIPQVTALSPLVRLVLAPNPSPMTLDGTNTYIVGDTGPIVIDPGPDHDEHLSLVAKLAGRPSLIVLTHRHTDHAAGAGRFAEMTGAPIASAPGRSERDIPVVDGEEIGTGDATLRAIATPGHSSDHFCFLLTDEGALFTGDHILGDGTTVVAYPDGDMEAYMRSLYTLQDLEVRRMYPGHGPVIDEPEQVLDYYIQHRLDRERQVLEGLGPQEQTVQALVASIYADVDPALHPIAAMSVRAHLSKLAREGRAAERDGRWRSVT